jgi:hypothetical protein
MEVRTRCDTITHIKFLPHTLRQSAARPSKASKVALRGALLTLKVQPWSR